MQPAELIDTYCLVWSEPLLERRAHLLDQVWADSATYTDPSVVAVGRVQLLQHINRVLNKRPGSRVVRTSQVDMHHGVARFAWRAIEADGKELPEGIDIAFIAEDGCRIERIIGFFGSLTARTAA